MAFERTGGIQLSVSGFVQGLLPNFIYVILDVPQIRTKARYNSLLHRGSVCKRSCSQHITHPSPAPVSTKSLIHYTVKLCATSFLTLEVSELKIRSLQIFKFHSCITKPTQTHWKEMHKERH